MEQEKPAESESRADPSCEKSDTQPSPPKNAFSRIFRYGTVFDYTLQSIAIVAAVASGAGIALQNLIFGEFITIIIKFSSSQTQSTPAQFRDNAARLALYFVYLGIGRFVLSYVWNSLLTYAAYRITRNLRCEYLKAALRQEVAFFDLGTGGSIATQVTSNGRLIQNGISEKLGLTFQGVSAFITAFIIAFVIQWKLTLICLCIAPATLLVNGAAAGIMAGHETKILTIHAQANAFAEGILSSMRTIHAFGMQGPLVAKFDQYLVEAHHVGKKLAPVFGTFFSAEYCIIYLGYALAFWQGVRMLARGEISEPGEIFTVLLSLIIASTNLTILAPYSIDFTRASAAASELFTLIDRKSLIDPSAITGEQPPEGIIGEVELSNVTFSYPSRPETNILEGFSLRAPAGKVTALVGPSGSGKSTIVGLLERWYSPKSGSISIDGRPIETLNLKWLRKTIRLVQQEPVLFHGSIFENIRQGLVGTHWEDMATEVQERLIYEAAEMAFAHDFIIGLPNGYHTQIGQRGSLLSGGQKQRIAIARSIVSQPKILLLDEATSALDPHAEGIVQQALNKACQGRTTIIIAHKLATLRNADNIVVIDKGRIVEQGTHDSLVKQNGVYSRLVTVQNLSIDEEESSSFLEETEVTAQAPDECLELTKTLTRHDTVTQCHLDTEQERDSYDLHKKWGVLRVISLLVRDTPELLGAYLVVLASCVVAGATYPGQAILLAHVMTVFELEGPEMENSGNFYAKMFIVLAGGVLIIYFLMGYTTTIVAQHLNHKLRKETLSDLLRQDLQFHDREENSTGALATHIDSHPQSILELMGYNIGLILVCVFNVATCSILAISFNWNLGLVVVCAGLPPLVGAGYLKIRWDSKLDHDISKRYSLSAAIASEAIAAIRTVSSLSIEELVLKKYLAELDQAIAGSKRPLFTMMICFAFTQAIEYWFLALGFWYGCRLLSLDKITMYQFFVSFLGVFFSGQSAAQLFQYSTSITKGINAANYIFWLRDLQPKIQETTENKDNSPGSGGSVNLDKVRFSYPLRPNNPVLRGINLTVKKGQFVAFVGASGCGKSTMIALLERFYDPSSGSIAIDKAPLTSLNPRRYRQLIGLVQQEPTLFQGSVRENIALGIDNDTVDPAVSTHVPDEMIEIALREANAWDFVCSLPDGLSTSAGSGGTQLSGGQRQRIAIARALVRNPKILLLDEATSALDTESEKMIQAALARAAKDSKRITIAVAHRLSTIRDADVICVFHKGKIEEMGTHEELAALGGIYRKMCEAQALD